MLACRDYSDAKRCRQPIDGKGLTKQAWAIIPKIAEVDDLISPEIQIRIKEGHPEVSFAQMNGGEPLCSSKHTIEGQQGRVRLLATYFPNIACFVQQHNRIAEDVIDAFAMLWTAQRIRNGRASTLPVVPQKDSRGLLMQIWA
jgi:predicted RNase H-like nuclease